MPALIRISDVWILIICYILTSSAFFVGFFDNSGQENLPVTGEVVSIPKSKKQLFYFSATSISKPGFSQPLSKALISGSLLLLTVIAL